MAKKVQLEGIDKLISDLKGLKSGLTTIASRGARAGSTIVRRKTASYAPIGETGELKSGFTVKRERTKRKGRAVYDIIVDPAKNSIFAKTSKSGKRSYYPNSQEFGFKTVDGGYVPGYRYMWRAANDSQSEFTKRVIEVAGKAVDKALTKQNGGGK